MISCFHASFDEQHCTKPVVKLKKERKIIVSKWLKSFLEHTITIHVSATNKGNTQVSDNKSGFILQSGSRLDSGQRLQPALDPGQVREQW